MYLYEKMIETSKEFKNQLIQKVINDIRIML